MKISLKKCNVCCEENLQLSWHRKSKSKEICLRCEKSEIFGLSDIMILGSIEILDFVIESSHQTIKT
jgi:hypothetical protein